MTTETTNQPTTYDDGLEWDGDTHYFDSGSGLRMYNKASECGWKVHSVQFNSYQTYMVMKHPMQGTDILSGSFAPNVAHLRVGPGGTFTAAKFDCWDGSPNRECQTVKEALMLFEVPNQAMMAKANSDAATIQRSKRAEVSERTRADYLTGMYTVEPHSAWRRDKLRKMAAYSGEAPQFGLYDRLTSYNDKLQNHMVCLTMQRLAESILNLEGCVKEWDGDDGCHPKELWSLTDAYHHYAASAFTDWDYNSQDMRGITMEALKKLSYECV